MPLLPVPQARTPARLDVRGVSLRLSGVPILHGINLTLEPGRKLAIVGPNGSGKSTLLRCLYGWHIPDSGTVALNGHDLADIPAAARGRDIAVLTQDSAPGLGLTISEVVAMGRLPHRRAWALRDVEDAAPIARALDAVGMSGTAQRDFATLSGGERQRVMFARAIAQNPSLLILDEPTNHLDIRHQLELLELVSAWGVSVVATLHDLTLAARWCDSICVLEAGHIVAMGEPNATLDAPLIEKVYGVRAARTMDAVTGRVRLDFYAAAEDAS